jgi:predicted enzyme related to lactoylglutathione lyase
MDGRVETRLVGVELFAERAGDSATFYSWLLGPGSGSSATDWNPVSLLFDHGVCGVRVAGDGGPRPSWVPVIAVPDPAETIARGEAEGYTSAGRDERTYLVDDSDWLRLVPAGRLPREIDPTALGATTVEWQSHDARRATDRLSRTLGLDAFQVVDDPGDYLLLVADGTLNLGVVDFSPLAPGLEDSWLVYFDVPDLELTIARTRDAGVEVVVPPVDEGYAAWSVLRDPFGVLFGLATYTELGDSGRMVRDSTGEVFPIGDKVRRR